MSKKKRSAAGKSAGKKKKTPTSSADPALPPEPGQWKRIFWITALAGLLLLGTISLFTGINGDDEYQNDYSTKLVDYYGSFGADTAALNIPKGNMHYYGGFFDLVTGAINGALGFTVDDAGYHNVRHLFNALLGWLAMLFIAFFVRDLAGYRAALFAFLLAFLSPRFFGHSLMNPKDIPFAMGYIMALYFLFRLLRSLPQTNWRLLLGMAGGVGIALATRAGGLLLLGYIGLFAAAHYLSVHGLKGFGKPQSLVPYLKLGLIGGLGGYVIGVLFWPFALVNPIGHPLEALTEFSNLGIRIRVLFEGQNVMSDGTPWYYPLSWMMRTIPLIVLIGFFAALPLYRKLTKHYGGLPINLLLFTSLFPLAYIIYKDSLLHDGWRHLMFVYPGIVILAALAWLEGEKLVRGHPAVRVVAVLLLLLPASFIVRNSTLSYVYFNEAFGGLSAAYGNYETDYWGVSVKEAIDWMESEGIISPDMTDSLTIASSYSYILRKQLGDRYGEIITVRYVRYNSRYDLDWDYAIFPTRYVRGPHLREGIWPPAQSVHTVTANGVPLTTVLKAESTHAFAGAAALKQRNWPEAITALQAEVEQNPDNEVAWEGLANAYLNTGEFAKAEQAAENLLEVTPDRLTGLYFAGVAKLNQGDTDGARQRLSRAVEVDPTYAVAYYYLALIEQNRGDLTSALLNLENAIEANPRFKAAYELAASIYEKQGNQQRANEMRRIAQSM